MKKLSLLILALLGVLIVVPAEAQTAAAAPDLVLYDAKIITVDPAFSLAQAITIRADRILAVGSSSEMLALAGPDTLRLDLKGRTVVPGLIDTHSHVHSYSERNYGGELGARKMNVYPLSFQIVKTKEDVLRQIEGTLQALQPEPGEWVHFVTTGLRDPSNVKMLYDDLNRWELDRVTPENPIAMSMGIPIENGYLINSRGMDILWSRYGDFIEKYGRYWLDEQGRPDGHLEPPANRFVMNHFKPRPSPEDLARIYNKTLEEWASMGVTTISTKLPEASVRAYQLLEERGQLKVRMAYGADWFFGEPDPEKTFEGIRSGQGTDKVWLSSVTLVAVDGAGARQCTEMERNRVSTGGGTMGLSLLGDWYPTGQCHLDIEYQGGPVGRGAPIQANYFREWLGKLARSDLRLANTHVSGDGAQSKLITTLEEINRQTPLAGKRWALDHCSLVNPEDIPRAARIGAIWSCYSQTLEGAANVAKVYSEEVAHTFISPVKTMVDAGIHVAFEMDRDDYVWKAIELFLTREINGKVWGPHERLDRETTLRMITIWAAEYVLKEDRLGSLEAGKLADLVVLDRDYLTAPAREFSETQPLLTLLGGEIVYLHLSFSQEYDLHPAGAVISTYSRLRDRHVRWP